MSLRNLRLGCELDLLELESRGLVAGGDDVAPARVDAGEEALRRIGIQPDVAGLQVGAEDRVQRDGALLAGRPDARVRELFAAKFAAGQRARSAPPACCVARTMIASTSGLP